MGATERDEAGFAAVDALTALVILSTTIALSIGALSSARKIQQAASETSAARAALQLLVVEASRPPGDYSGVSGQFDWTIHVSELAGPSTSLKLCQQAASIRPRTGHRRYDLETQRPCPPDAPRP
jgi:hypothetical protein